MKQTFVLILISITFSCSSIKFNNEFLTSSNTTLNIDFDEASKSWQQNKSPLGNGTYKYVCGAITKTGNKCKNHPNCKLHNKQYKKIPAIIGISEYNKLLNSFLTK